MVEICRKAANDLSILLGWFNFMTLPQNGRKCLNKKLLNNANSNFNVPGGLLTIFVSESNTTTFIIQSIYMNRYHVLINFVMHYPLIL